MTENDSQPNGNGSPNYDAIVVGAGFCGLYLLHRMRDGMGLSVKVIQNALLNRDKTSGSWG